ncbi:MAG: hypothetical protein KIT58_20135 [Planctomycetota bacterium]|nr:hypothetical protein [Planctomycetota bacterium]
MSDYDFSWWEIYFSGRTVEDIAKFHAIIPDLLALETGPSGDARSAEEKDLTRSYDPAAMRYAAFINSVAAFASAGLIGPSDVPAVAAEAARLGLEQKTIGFGPGVPRITADVRRVALDQHCRQLLDAIFSGRLDDWMRENEPDDIPRE